MHEQQNVGDQASDKPVVNTEANIDVIEEGKKEHRDISLQNTKMNKPCSCGKTGEGCSCSSEAGKMMSPPTSCIFEIKDAAEKYLIL